MLQTGYVLYHRLSMALYRDYPGRSLKIKSGSVIGHYELPDDIIFVQWAAIGDYENVVVVCSVVCAALQIRWVAEALPEHCVTCLLFSYYQTSKQARTNTKYHQWLGDSLGCCIVSSIPTNFRSNYHQMAIFQLQYCSLLQDTYIAGSTAFLNQVANRN